MQRININRLSKFVGSNKFFAIILGLFIFQAAWIALSAVYPQPFDENSHFALIKIYASHWSPFLVSQPHSADSLGSVVHDPSYLFHYLLSFPYRVFAHFVTSSGVQIIFLRFLNIALFSAALILFKKLFQKTKVSPSVVNTALLFFVLVPVVPFLAGQINYDNLLMLFVAGSLLLLIKLIDKLKTGELDVALALTTTSVLLLGCLVQVEFIPILLASSAIAIYQFIVAKCPDINWGKVINRWAAVIFVLVSFGLMWQRYGVNYVKYGTPIPSCAQVLTIKQCSSDGAWTRDNQAAKTKHSVSRSPIRYSASWFARMFIYSFYVSSGGNQKAHYKSYGPLPIISFIAITVFGFGALLFARYFFEFYRDDKNLIYMLMISTFFIFVLWAHLYADYLRTGQKYGINGRYLFPAILPIMAAIGMSYQRLLAKRKKALAALFIVSVLGFSQGGGIITFIVASNQYWYWDSSAMRQINQNTKKLINPLILKQISSAETAKQKVLDKWHGH